MSQILDVALKQNLKELDIFDKLDDPSEDHAKLLKLLFANLDRVFNLEFNQKVVRLLVVALRRPINPRGATKARK